MNTCQIIQKEIKQCGFAGLIIFVSLSATLQRKSTIPPAPSDTIQEANHGFHEANLAEKKKQDPTFQILQEVASQTSFRR